MITSLFEHFQKNTTLVTPNQRLAATLFKKYNQHQEQQGKTGWPTTDLLPLSSWIERLWDNYCAEAFAAPGLLLSANQELILWEEIIQQSPESEPLLKLSELAKQAKAAWSTLKRWRTDFQHPSFALTENSRAFQSWAEQFAERCQQENWIDTVSVADLVLEKIQQGKISLPEKLVLLNFTEITPQYRALLQAGEQQGLQLEYQHYNAPQTTCGRLCLADEEKEIQTMACWAKRILEQEPEATIGCISANLEEKRNLIVSIFNDLFESAESFNISAGKTLASYPLIQSALHVLALPRKTISIETLSFILASPYLGDAETENLSRIHFDSLLHRQNITSTTWSRLLEKTPSLETSCPRLSARIKTFLHLQTKAETTQRISQWMQHFAALLEALGWPGEQSLNSAEYQVAKCWIELLKETASLDNILAPLPSHKALHYLGILAAKTYFQPQLPEAPIQILGQLEGAGLPFDYLWVTGMDDTAWPPAPSPNPLLPHDLQKRLHMPNATAERQLEYSLKLTEQFKQAASTVIFSYSEQKGQESLSPSPLLVNLKQRSIADLDLAAFTSAIHKIFSAQSLENLQDEQAPPLALTGKIQGGTRIFEMQAACPFKAFAKLRLHATAREEARPGLPAKLRGSIVHRILELFWTEVGSQGALLSLDEASLQNKLRQTITLVLQDLAPFLQPESLYRHLVIQRLEKLFQDWLAIEKSRPPFKVIAQEEEKTIELNRLQFTVRVDRVDELEGGGKLIIDYKTKKNCELSDWFGERLSEPQLPLYCLHYSEQTVGLAFAQLHAAKTGLKGLAEEDLAISGIKTISSKTKADASTWEAQLEQWRLHLTQLFHDFQSGHATVDPKNPQSCESCDLQTLCRIYERDSIGETT